MKKSIPGLFLIVFFACIIAGSAMAQVQHQLWGMTTRGGQNADGVIFKTDASGNYEMVKMSFSPDGPNNTDAYGSLMLASDGNLYGMTWYDGTNGDGTIFSYDPRTSSYTNRYSFVSMTEGRWPQGGSLIQVGGLLYGMTTAGGSADDGVIFTFDPVSNTYTKKAEFTGTANGNFPYGSLLLATDGKLYGMTSMGGLNDDGVLFQYDPAGNTITVKVQFDGAAKGSVPYGSLMQATDGKIYGMTSQGGANGYGVMFQFNPVTGNFTNLWDFDLTTGAFPYGSLIQATGGDLYGLTSAGGASNAGVLFRVVAGTHAPNVVFSFDSSPNGDTPLASLLQATDGNLYGMTSMGGAETGPASLGMMFQYNPGTKVFTNKFNFAGNNGSNPEYTSLIEIPVTISTGAVSLTNCVGSSVVVPYSIEGSYDPGNTFTVQLSNAAGSFASPVVIGSIESTGAGNITCTIPAGTAPGTGYRVRVMGSKPVVTGSDNGTNISVNAMPATATTLSGPAITATQAGASYQWLNCLTGKTVIAGETGKTFTATVNGSYAVIITMSGNGCIDTSACVTVSHIGIDEIPAGRRFSVYPNPASGMVTVKMPGTGTLEISSIGGQVVMTIDNAAKISEIDLSKLAKGVYILKAMTGNETFTERLIRL